MHTYGTMLFRLCLITLGNASDAEDAVQETMIKYLQKKPRFEHAAHVKAWLLTVASNKCRDMLRFRSRYPMVDIDEIKEFAQDTSESGVLDAFMTLPDKYRTVLVLLIGDLDDGIYTLVVRNLWVAQRRISHL